MAEVVWHGDKLTKQVSLKCLQAMRKICLLIEADAKRYCPVDTGRLRDSITHEIEISKNRVTGRVGTNVVYGVYQEYGTRYQSGKPYLRPALEKNKGKIKQLLKGR